MALIIELTVVPQSPEFKIFLAKNGLLKCHLKSAPEKGAANKELVKQLSKTIGVVQDLVEIVSGLTVRKKRIKIHTSLTLEEFYGACGIPWQKDIQ